MIVQCSFNTSDNLFSFVFDWVSKVLIANLKKIQFNWEIKACFHRRKYDWSTDLKIGFSRFSSESAVAQIAFALTKRKFFSLSK